MIAQCRATLDLLNIRNIVNAAAECSCDFREDPEFTYVSLDLDDTALNSLRAHLQPVLAFMTVPSSLVWLKNERCIYLMILHI